MRVINCGIGNNVLVISEYDIETYGTLKTIPAC